MRLTAYNDKGLELTLRELLARVGRMDDGEPRDPSRAPIWARFKDGKSVRAALAQKGKAVTLTWPGDAPARLELPWPVKDDGFNALVMDDDGNGYADGATLELDRELAQTQYRLLKESWRRRTTDWSPLYKPSRKARELLDRARDSMAEAAAIPEPVARSRAWHRALKETLLAWEKLLFEHGLQIARDERRAKGLRFGLTLDDSLLKRVEDFAWIAEAVDRSGSNWVRLVFRPNPDDFTYASLRSFNEYDGAIELLRKRGIAVMGCVLDTAQWPRALTPDAYAERVKNLVLHYKGRVSSWEVGSELNGDWLGGASHPLSPAEVYRIFAAGAAKAKELDPGVETVATLYWWEATAPDRAHSLSGWLAEFAPKGFGKTVDLVGLEVFPHDNPAGAPIERAFNALYEALPGTPLMLSSFGYVEKEPNGGYWWLAPDDVDGGRKDLVILYTAAACAMPGSVCGGFWWQTLDQMLPPGRRKATDLYRVYRRTMTQLGRRE